MLQSLHVHNFALLEDAAIDFSEGFNVFTGETGAGKSILTDAFAAVLGGRASAASVRSGTDAFWVQAVFELEGLPELQAYLAEQGLDNDTELFLKRQVNAAGKSRAWVNGVPVPLAVLKHIGTALVDMHGQHENQALLDQQAPRLLTDAFGGAEAAAAKADYAQAYAAYTALKQQLAALQQDNGQRELLMERCEWEIKELTEAGLRPGEDQELEAESRILQHAEKILRDAGAAHELLDGENMALTLLARAKNCLEDAGRYDAKLLALAENAGSAWLTLDDCRQQLGAYLNASDFNGERAAAVQERLDLLYRLHKKYGGSTEAALEHLAVAQARYRDLAALAEALAATERILAAALRQLEHAAAALTAVRQKYAAELSRQITEHLHDLAMPGGVFAIAISKRADFTPHGQDALTFMFSANMGEPVREMQQVASGGELSRIALAVKTVMLNKSGVPVMVFDEIDSGVGGVTAQKMAEKLAIIAGVAQVLCITHLPQIAVFADRHIHIEKRSAGGRTATLLQVLDREGRIREIMRMTAGENTGRGALLNAGELLAAAEEIKKTRLGRC